MATPLDRRSLLRGGLLAAAGAAAGASAGVAGGAALASSASPGPAGADDVATVPAARGAVGTQRVASTAPERQPGVDTPPGAHALFRAHRLKNGLDAQRLRAWLRMLSEDAGRLMRGEPVVADVEPELGDAPASLSITVGLGPGAVRLAGTTPPSWLAPLPKYRIDRLEERWGQADVLVQATCDDPLTLAHADRVLQRQAAPFADTAWVQEGFRYARGARPDGSTMRNLFGQVDGTSNPVPGTEDFDAVVYREGDGPFGAGSTSLVLRRISMDLDLWDEVDRPAREDSIGRRLDTGAPVTGGSEKDEVDLAAMRGPWPVVADFAHVRRARAQKAGERFYRRGFNYANPGASGAERAGLIFATYQADPVKQYHPVQARLAELDMLNEWTSPVGSAVFWIPPAASQDGFVGEGLFA